MNNFLLVFIRFGGFFSFLLLESLSLYLVVKYNRNQQEIYFHSANRVMGSWDNFSNNFTKFYKIEDQARKQASLNAKLLEELEISKINRTLLGGQATALLDTTGNPPDTLRNADALQRFTYIVAEVIANSIVRPDNYMTISKGGADGVAPGMGVLSSDGLIGIVRDTTRHFSLVMSLLHEQTNVSIAVRRNKYFGTLSWKAPDPRYMILSNIPKHADLLKGDTIQTSGFSSIFPAGFMAGTLDSFWVEAGSSNWTGRVKLSNDLVRPGFVFVVKTLLTEEEKTVEQWSKNGIEVQ